MCRPPGSPGTRCTPLRRTCRCSTRYSARTVLNRPPSAHTAPPLVREQRRRSVDVACRRRGGRGPRRPTSGSPPGPCPRARRRLARHHVERRRTSGRRARCAGPAGSRGSRRTRAWRRRAAPSARSSRRARRRRPAARDPSAGTRRGGPGRPAVPPARSRTTPAAAARRPTPRSSVHPPVRLGDGFRRPGPRTGPPHRAGRRGRRRRRGRRTPPSARSSLPRTPRPPPAATSAAA